MASNSFRSSLERCFSESQFWRRFRGCSFVFFKPRLGRKALALAAVPFLLAGIALLLENHREKPNAGPPRIISAEKLSGLVKKLPTNARFSYSGISFFNGKLYAGTNLGIIEFSGTKATQLYQFQSSDSVVSGPWTDIADGQLWAVDDHTNELITCDGNTWTRMAEPIPANGYTSRGDVLEGIKPVGNANGFWLASAGSAWKWNSTSNQWQPIAGNLPQSSDYKRTNEIIGVLPIGQTAMLIVRHEPLEYLVRPGEDFLSDEVAVGSTPTPTEIRRDGKPFLADSWTATHDAGYICSKDQRVFQVTTERATEMVAPGHAKASPQTAIGTFLPASGAKGCFAMKRKNGRFWPRRPIRVGRENIGLTCPLLPANWPWRSTGSRLSTNSIPVVVICGLFKMLQRPSGSSMEGFSRRSDSDPELVRAFPGFKIEVRAPLFLPPMNFQERVAQMAQ